MKVNDLLWWRNLRVCGSVICLVKLLYPATADRSRLCFIFEHHCSNAVINIGTVTSFLKGSGTHSYERQGSKGGDQSTVLNCEKPVTCDLSGLGQI